MRILPPLLALVVVSLSSPLSAQQPAPALRIVVIEGEGGVNIIQQKTAVRPLIEVRDRNNLPVSGASVTFTIGGGNSAAFAGGAQTLTVTTNAAGQAAASGLNAVSSGAFQIQVQAAYQGQVATAAISQTNFATAAAASQAGATAGAGGGGMSATTIGIVGAAVAGGAVAATQVAGKSDSDEENFDGFDGTLAGQVLVLSQITGGATCTFTRNVSGTIRIEMVGGTANGRAALSMTQTDVSLTGNCNLGNTPITFRLVRESTPVSGGPSALSFNGTAPVGTETYGVQFQGSLSGNTITGTLLLTVSSPAGVSPSRSGSTAMPVTLTGPRP